MQRHSSFKATALDPCTDFKCTRGNSEKLGSKEHTGRKKLVSWAFHCWDKAPKKSTQDEGLCENGTIANTQGT